MIDDADFLEYHSIEVKTDSHTYALSEAPHVYMSTYDYNLNWSPLLALLAEILK